MDMQNIESQFTELKSQLAALEKKTAEDKLSMVVFSGDLDKIIAAFVIAPGSQRCQKKCRRQRRLRQNVRRHAAQRAGQGKAFPDEHGGHGHGHDEIFDEKEERGLTGGISGNGGRTRGADLRLRNVDGSDGI